MGEPEKLPKLSPTLRSVLVILGAFTVIVWVAVEPWSAFVREAAAPILPSPEASRPPGATGVGPLLESPTAPESEIGAPVPAGQLAVRGRAVDAKGEPIKGALATVRVLERALPRALEGLEAEGRALGERQGELRLEERSVLWRQLVWGKTTAEVGAAVSHKDGRFEVIGVAPVSGTLALELRSPAGGPLQAVATELHASLADVREGALGVGQVALHPLVHLTVFVTDATGARGLAGARIELRLGKSELLPLVATTAADGTCEIVAPAGEHELAASLEGFGREAASVRLSGTSANVALALSPAPR